VPERTWSLVADLSGSGRSRRLLAGVRAGRKIRVGKETWQRWAFVHLRPLGGAGVRLSPVVDRTFSCLADLGVRRDGRVPVLRRDGPDPDGPVVIAPGAGRATKQWPAERFGEVARRLAESGRGSLVVGTPAEEPLLREVAGAGGARAEVDPCADPGDLPAIVARGCAALTNDSGILHVAEACGLPVVALFGPTHPRLGFAPLRADSVGVHTGIPCSPCDLHGPATCPRGHHRCLQDLSVDAVLRALEERLPAGARR
jgi:ADP-heptose:LPS heptosyltransferase